MGLIKLLNKENVGMDVTSRTMLDVIIAIGNRKDAVEEAFNVKLENNMAFLPGVVSRKKQVVPVLEKCM